ncbi:MAG: 2-amino-4-hydroxy-6-hydroxymethyldihydropteridine diphosphokinase [Myxococcaceae bacterium]|nr:2-amino-4-hydroxy-6-hydroxymethyldihydropteridine diphosphokinase [Myxococcaceae bacterium]
MVYVGLGSNLGDRRAHLDAAVRELKAARVSRYLETPALLAPGDTVAQPAYLNAVAELHTDLEPQALLSRLREIEQAEGRPAQRARWQARTLDLDVLLYGDRVIDTPNLKVPHPAMHERRFVLEPLAELAPELVHPVLKKSVAELLAQL